MFYRYASGWRQQRWPTAYAMACAAHSADQACQSDARQREPESGHSWMSWSSGPMFGVRRPLRKLSWRLDLREQQAQRMADVLNRLKTAYAQARLDRERSTADVAALFDGDAFEPQAASAALAQRTRASSVLADELQRELARVFELLDVDQRREFARMIRAGELIL